MTSYEVPLIDDEHTSYEHLELPPALDINGTVGADASGLDADFYQIPPQQGEQL